MELQVAVTSMHFSQPSVSYSSSQPFSSPSLHRRRFSGGDLVLFCRHAEISLALHRRRRFSRCTGNSIKRALNASLNHHFSDEKFTKSTYGKFQDHRKPFEDFETPEFPARQEIIPANIESIVNSIDIPFSLKMIRRTRQLQKGLIQAGETACCSVKKAFISTVFIIRELQSFTLQMREALFYEDLQGILEHVHIEIHASFVWLFQKVFSQTPTLMVYLMILLANYSVHSMSTISTVPPLVQTHIVHEVLCMEDQKIIDEINVDSSIVNKPTLSSLFGEFGGNGGKYRPVASGTDGDNRFNESDDHRMISRNEESSFGINSATNIDEDFTEQEKNLWESFVDEAYKMQVESRDGLDQETMQLFVSPINVHIDSEHYSEYLRTEQIYQMELAHEPDNPLLLANFAQFLYLCVQDFDRAEEFFKRATKVEPKDGEALNRYAHFIWQVRKNVLEAEQKFLEAMDIEPDNAFYQADYARFLWSTGEEDICFI